MVNKDLEYYLNLDWTLIEGEDLDFEGNPYHYIEIQEIPSFTFCAKTIEKARENYKRQLKLTLMVMLESGELTEDYYEKGKKLGYTDAAIERISGVNIMESKILITEIFFLPLLSVIFLLKTKTRPLTGREHFVKPPIFVNLNIYLINIFTVLSGNS